VAALGSRDAARRPRVGQLLQVAKRKGAKVADQRRLPSVALGDRDRLHPRRPRGLGHRQRTGNRADAAVQRQLAGQRVAAERLARQLPRGGEQRRRDRQVEPGPLLSQVGRRQVGGDPLQGES
jgi:hypothetical protein